MKLRRWGKCVFTFIYYDTDRGRTATPRCRTMMLLEASCRAYQEGFFSTPMGLSLLKSTEPASDSALHQVLLRLPAAGIASGAPSPNPRPARRHDGGEARPRRHRVRAHTRVRRRRAGGKGRPSSSQTTRTVTSVVAVLRRAT